MQYTIYGASDDLVEIDSTGSLREELSAYEQSVELLFGTEDEGVYVFVTYTQTVNGSWLVGVVQPGEDGETQLPEGWRVYAQPSAVRYSPALVVECPDSTPVHFRKYDNAGNLPTRWCDLTHGDVCEDADEDE